MIWFLTLAFVLPVDCGVLALGTAVGVAFLREVL